LDLEVDSTRWVRDGKANRSSTDLSAVQIQEHLKTCHGLRLMEHLHHILVSFLSFASMVVGIDLPPQGESTASSKSIFANDGNREGTCR